MKLALTIEIDIPDNANINQAENIIFKKVQETGKESILQFIVQKKAIVENISGLRFKDTRNRTLETKFGVISFEKKKFYDSQSKKSITPIIQALGLKPRQTTTFGLQKLGVDMAIETTYGYAKKKLEENNHLIRSKTAIWNDVQKFGKQILEKQNKEMENLYANGEVQSQNNAIHDVVAIEMDETMINSCDLKDSKKHVPRLAILYTAKKKEGKKRYILQNKRFIAQIEKPETFGKRLFFESVKHYNISQAKQTVTRSDGARWIHNVREEHFSSALWQTDPHHVIEKIKIFKLPTTTEKHWIEHIQKGKPQLLRKDIIASYHKNKSELFKKFLGYIDRNLEGLKPLPQLKDKTIPWLKRKMFVRGSGAMERNVGGFIVDRMKNQRMRWSNRGANNLLMLKSLKSQHKEWNQFWKELAA